MAEEDPSEGVAPPSSGLLDLAQQGKAGIAATFGGQGYSYIDEARKLYADPATSSFMETVLEAVVAEANSPEAIEAAAHPAGFDVSTWLEDPAKTPSSAYLASAPVSYPLVGLVQIAHYVSTLSTVGKKHEEMCALLKGATGHSQGVVAAVAVACSSTDAELLANSTQLVSPGPCPLCSLSPCLRAFMSSCLRVFVSVWRSVCVCVCVCVRVCARCDDAVPDART
jgi:hypothetical protein